MKPILAAPTIVSLIITDVCNLKCTHCQNFWRDDNDRFDRLSASQIDKLAERFSEAGIFHVVISGGEPFVDLESLIHAIRRFIAAGMSIGVNSNLVLATPDKIKRLLDAGCDHILTSLCSHDPETNDRLVNMKGAFDKIVRGIECAVKNGMRVSVNNVVQRLNKDHVYETGRLVADLGCQRLFGTRSVIPPYASTPEAVGAYLFSPEEAYRVLDDLLRVKSDFGLPIGSLISYPLCFLGDLEKYRDFVGRGCPSQSGHAVGIYANGTVVGCCHVDQSYGNALEEPLSVIYERMRPWRTEQHYEGCAGCEYIDLCESGCRTTAFGVTGSFKGRDPLMVGPRAPIKPPAPRVPDPELLRRIEAGLRFVVPSRIRFRRESGFTLVNARWGNTLIVSEVYGEFLKTRHGVPEGFTLAEFPGDADKLAGLYMSELVECPDLEGEARSRFSRGFADRGINMIAVE